MLHLPSLPCVHRVVCAYLVFVAAAPRRILKESTDEIATLVVKHIRRKVMRQYNSSKDHGQHELIALTHKCMLQVRARSSGGDAAWVWDAARTPLLTPLLVCARSLLGLRWRRGSVT